MCVCVRICVSAHNAHKNTNHRLRTVINNCRKKTSSHRPIVLAIFRTTPYFAVHIYRCPVFPLFRFPIFPLSRFCNANRVACHAQNGVSGPVCLRVPCTDRGSHCAVLWYIVINAICIMNYYCGEQAERMGGLSSAIPNGETKFKEVWYRENT